MHAGFKVCFAPSICWYAKHISNHDFWLGAIIHKAECCYDVWCTGRLAVVVCILHARHVRGCYGLQHLAVA